MDKNILGIFGCRSMVTTMAFAFAMGSAQAQEQTLGDDFDFASLECVDAQGQEVEYVEKSYTELREKGVWFAYAAMRQSKPKSKPIIFYETEFLGATAGVHRAFVMAHECAHHRNGDLYGGGQSPNPAQQGVMSDAEIKEEHSADCMAIEYLISEEGYGQTEVNLIKSNAKVFFDFVADDRPELSIFLNNRLVEIQACYDDFTPK